MKRTVGYWIATVLVALAMVAGGIMDVTRNEQIAAAMSHLGYPLYFAVILGLWKVAGGIAIAAPGTPLIKEWAYAGIIFDLTGAAASHASVGDPIANIMTPVVLVALTVVSYVLRPDSRRLKQTAGAREPVALRASVTA